MSDYEKELEYLDNRITALEIDVEDILKRLNKLDRIDTVG